MQLGNQTALGTETEPIGSVLDIAPGHDAPVIDKRRSTYWEL
jgi:hypothetical protein